MNARRLERTVLGINPSSDETRLGNGPNTVSESTVGSREATGRELSAFLSACYMCANLKADSLIFFAELTEFASELSEFSLPKPRSENSIPPVS